MRRILGVLAVVGVSVLGLTVSTALRASAASSVETNAVNWAIGQIGSTGYGGLCLTLVTDAYQTGAGFNIESRTNYGSFNSSTYPQEVWGDGFNSGTTGGSNTTPPYGALVFYNASGPGASDPADYSHISIMGSGGEMVSTNDVVNESAVHYETMAQVAAAHPYNTYVGWWLPDGTTNPPPPPPPLPSPGDYGSFNRYQGPNGHYETAGPQPSGTSFELSLGEILKASAPGTVEWYSCLNGTDEFTSTQSNCEGKTVVGPEGFAYSSPPPGLVTVPVYRCVVTTMGTHFDTNASNCEGQTVSGGLLGYLLGATSFNRYVGPNGHNETAGPQPSGTSFESSLGEILKTAAPGTVEWFSCLLGTDEFTSIQPNCEGQTLIGPEGFAYSSPPPGMVTVPVYRCRVTTGGTHFDTNASNCEGQTADIGLLGYLLGATSFNRFNGPNGHYETAGPQPSGTSFESSLGEILKTSAPGTVELYSCLNGTDEFTSTQSNCEGKAVVGPEGFAYSSPPPGLVTVPVYRCVVTTTGTHFDTNLSNCEGQTLSGGLLGYLLANGWTSLPLQVSSNSQCTMTVDTQLTCQITSTGTPIPSISESGALPSGVTFSDNGDGTATLAGDPAAGTGGTYPIAITDTNGIGPAATQAFTLMVWQAPTVTSEPGATFIEGIVNSFTPNATGYPAPIISENGTLPAGVTYTSAGLSGTPTQSGTFPITLTAHNGVGVPSTQTFTLTVLPIGITTASLPNGSVYSKTNKVIYSASLAASGGNLPYKWSLASSSLPPGLKLSSKGVISGKAKTAGAYSFTVQVVDTKTKTKPPTQNKATATLSITIG